MQKHYFYVAFCADGTLYGGYTKDITRREYEHNNQKGAKYTAFESRRPVKIIYFEEYETRKEATKREYYVKQQTRKWKLTLLKEKGIILE